MQGHDHSYLDLSVLPELRPYVLSCDAVALFREDLSSIIWSNAAGARLLGGKGIADLLSARLSDGQSFVRQLGDAVSQLEDGNSLLRGFRVHQGLRSRLLQCEISRIQLSPDDFGLMLVCNSDDPDVSGAEHQLAEDAVKALDGFADASAILDDFGLPLAASASFDDVGLSEDVLAGLAQELRDEDDRLIKRPVKNLPGNVFVAGLARINDTPGRSLLVLADAAIADDGPDVDASINDESDGPTGALVDEPASDASENTGKVEETTRISEQLTKPETFQDETLDGSGLTGTSLPDEAHENQTDAQGEDVSVEHEPPIQEAPLENRWYARSPENSGDSSGDSGSREIASEHQEEPEETASGNPENEFTFGSDEEAVRFAWIIDENCNFQSVSPELAQTVGPNAADIVSRNWSDVASVFGFDSNREIKRLLEQRDTWSGKTVMWPIQGTDLVVPVDLAALPAFGSGKKFEGFRGFGIIRTADAVLDPDETGLALVNAIELPETQTITSDDEPEIAIQPKIDEEDTSADEADPSNVFKLVPRETFEVQQSTKIPADTSLLEKLQVAVLVYRSGETLYANRELLKATGYEDIDELATAGGVDAILDQTPQQDVGEMHLQRLIRKDGTRYHISPVLHTVPWAGDKALLLSFQPDSAEKSKEPPAIAITEASEVQNILDTASDGILVLETDGTILSINASAEALFGYSYDDISGETVADLFAIESREVINDYVSSLSSPGVSAILNDGREVIGREAKGGLIPIFVNISRMDSTGKLCAVVRDMTSWKNAEEELVKARRQAELANEQKSDFLAHVSHEIRTPLNAIIGFSDVMIEERFGPIDNERYREYLRDINRSGTLVLDLINDLLDLSKIEAGKMELAFEAVDLNQIVSESVALLQPQANANRVIIRTSLSRAVPKVVADTRSIRQIILNLVSNAIKYSPVSGQVIVSTVYESNGEVALRIRDTGDGMSEAQIEEAMKPFQQVHGISEKRGEGTGLGLPLTKALVEANRAYFDLESEPDSGTIAHVQFPTQRVLAD